MLGWRCTGANNLTPVITLKNLLPPGRGPMLRDGPALAIPDRDGETGPATRLQREGILIPDLMVAFEINVAGVIARRGYLMLSQRGAPAFLAWVGAPGGNPRPAPGGRGYGEPARDEDAKGQWRHTRVILAPMWFPSSRTCSACGTVNPKLKRERTWICPNCGPGMTGTCALPSTSET